jgi:hypothetical protein
VDLLVGVDGEAKWGIGHGARRIYGAEGARGGGDEGDRRGLWMTGGDAGGEEAGAGEGSAGARPCRWRRKAGRGSVGVR